MRRALLLDRDGVINVDHGYVHARERFEFVPGVEALCGRFQRSGYVVVVVTNQAGIGRGLYTEADFCALSRWMTDELSRRGVSVERIYFCPFHPEHGIGAYRQDSFDRKPNPGMLLKAQAELDLDLASSVMIGDKPSDVEAAIRAGVGRPILFMPDESANPSVNPALAEHVVVVRSLDEVFPIEVTEPTARR